MTPLPIERRRLVTRRVEFSATLRDVDVQAVRAAFSRLFDQAAESVFRAGLDQDDAVVERFVVCRCAAGPDVRVPLPCLATAEALCGVVRAALGNPSTSTSDIENVRITALEVDVIAESWRAEPGTDAR